MNFVVPSFVLYLLFLQVFASNASIMQVFANFLYNGLMTSCEVVY